MRFKTWLENLSGPGNGGTMDSAVGEVERVAKEIAAKGAGAFPTYNQENNPPKSGLSPDAKYYQKKKMRMHYFK